ncbi:22481_t:CDS:2 [Gigaspora rosea]|nr:22481_t:CDS:2 [Gigaspora rosea]
MEENDPSFKENSAEFEFIEPEVFDETSLCITASSSINANSSQSMLLVQWKITDQQAFYIVENDDFCAFILALDQWFSLSTRQAISLNTSYLFAISQQKFAITTDAWTLCVNLRYLAITLHWINEDWKIEKVLLDMVPLHKRHTEKYIAEKFLKQFLIMILDDCNNVDFERVGCAAHVLNLVVGSGMQVAINLFPNCVVLLVIFTNHSLCLKNLKKNFEMKEKPFLVPDLNALTHWNSTYKMIEKINRIREMTDILVAGNPILKEKYLNERDWVEINTIAKLLEPILQATNLLSTASYPTMGDLYTKFPVIIDYDILMIRRTIRKIYEKYQNVQTNSNFEISSNPSGSYFKKYLKRTLTNAENYEHE